MGDMIDMETVTLERMRIAATMQISKDLVEHFAMPPKVDIASGVDLISNAITLRVVQMVYGRTMEEVRAEYPVDWWQAFKERWFPAWAKKRWPVEWVRVRLEAKELYPKLSVPDYQPYLQLYRHCNGAGLRYDSYRQPEGS